VCAWNRLRKTGCGGEGPACVETFRQHNNPAALFRTAVDHTTGASNVALGVASHYEHLPHAKEISAYFHVDPILARQCDTNEGTALRL
jgi:hypothetical protein